MDILFTKIVQAPDILFILGMIIVIAIGSFAIGCITQQEEKLDDSTVFTCIAIFFFIVLAALGIFEEAKNPTGIETEYLYVAADSMSAEDFIKYDIVKAHDGVFVLTEKSEK